jgi:hypothetical protein
MHIYDYLGNPMKTNVPCLAMPEDRHDLNADSTKSKKQLVRFTLNCMSVDYWMALFFRNHAARDKTILTNLLIAEICCECSPLLVERSSKGGDVMVFELERIQRVNRSLAGSKMIPRDFQHACDRLASRTSFANHPTFATVREFLLSHGVLLKKAMIQRLEVERLFEHHVEEPVHHYLVDSKANNMIREDVAVEWSYLEARLWEVLIDADI